jgi:hypothetical protein
MNRSNNLLNAKFNGDTVRQWFALFELYAPAIANLWATIHQTYLAESMETIYFWNQSRLLQY